MAQQFVLEQNKLGFVTALQQVVYFYNILIDWDDFDAGKDSYKGKLILVEEIPNEEEEVTPKNDRFKIIEWRSKVWSLVPFLFCLWDILV